MKNLLCYFFSSVVILTVSCNKTDSLNSLHSNSTTNSTAGTANGLIAWYTFNGDTLDHSGMGNNVTFNSATPAPGKDGTPNTAYYFNGHSSYMLVPNSSSLNPKKGITMAVVIKPTGFYQGLCHGNKVINKGYADQSNGSYYIGYDDQLHYNFNGCYAVVVDTLENFYGVYGNTQFNNVGTRDSSDYIAKNRWYTVVFTVDTNKVGKLYVNGVLKSTVQHANADFTANTDNLYIGRMENPQYPYWFKGIIDEIRIYSRPFSDDAIRNLTNDMNK